MASAIDDCPVQGLRSSEGDWRSPVGEGTPWFACHRASTSRPVAVCPYWPPKKRAFLAAYAQTGNKRLAAEMAGIVKQTIYTRQWRGDREFQAALERAQVMSADVLEAEAFRRAVEGVEELVG